MNAKVASAAKPRTRRKARDPASIDVVAAVLAEPGGGLEDGEVESGEVESGEVGRADLERGDVETGDIETGASEAGEKAPSAPDAGSGPAARRKANQGIQRAESQAACAALERDILAARRKALSTLTGFAAVALTGLGGYGLAGGRSMALMAAAAAFLALVGLLFWPRERAMTRAEYLSLPHTQARNGRLRCIHCSNLGATLTEVQSSQGRRHECPKCRKLLFR